MVSEQGNSTTKVLDHGYVGLVETWGSDERIIEAARMSTNKGFQGWGDQKYACTACGDIPSTTTLSFNLTCIGCFKGEYQRVEGAVGDEKLLRYLYTHKHFTPFEMGGMTIEVQAPIFVFREWHRHRTLSAALDDDIGIDAYNELSARYTPLPDVNYVPTIERLLATSGKNKQAQGTVDAVMTHEKAVLYQSILNKQYENAQGDYQAFLAAGVPKELARLCVPVGRYSRMRASANLRNWLAFLTLRMDESAQWEIRQYANVVGGLISQHFPRTWELFKEKP